MLLCSHAQRLNEGGLADPCLTADQDKAALSGDGGSETFAQQLLFTLAPDEQRRRRKPRKGRTGRRDDNVPPGERSIA